MMHVSGQFTTRRAVELATEQLVQEYGVRRTDIFLQPVGAENTVGSVIAGADDKSASPGMERRTDGAVNGAIELSVDIADAHAGRVYQVLARAGATNIAGI